MIEARNANEAFSALLVPYIAKALDDDVPSVRCWSAEVLGKNGDRAAKAVPSLRRAAQDKNANVRKAAEEALKRIRAAKERVTIIADFRQAVEKALPATWDFGAGSGLGTILLRDKTRPGRFHAVVSILPPGAREHPGGAWGKGKTFQSILKADNGEVFLWAEPGTWKTISADLAKALVGEPFHVRPFDLDFVNIRGVRRRVRIKPNWLRIQSFGPQAKFENLCRSALARRPVADVRRVWLDTYGHHSMLLDDMADVLTLPARAGAAAWSDAVTRKTVADLVGDLGSKAPTVRQKAVWAFGKMGPAGKGAAGALIKAMKDRDPAVRHVAAWALGQVGAGVKDVVPALIVAMRYEDVQPWAVLALGRIGPPAVPQLIEALKGGQIANVRYGSARALGRIGPAAGQAVGALVRALKDKTRGLPWCAATALVTVDPAVAAREATPVLVQSLLTDEGGWKRGKSAEALGAIGPAAKAAVPALIRTLKDERAVARSRAACAIMAVAPETGIKEALPVLIEDLKAEHWDARFEAAGALGRIGPAAETAVPALVHASKDENRQVRQAAAEALKRIRAGKPKAIPFQPIPEKPGAVDRGLLRVVNLHNLYTDDEALRFKAKLDAIPNRPKQLKLMQLCAMVGIDPKRLGLGVGGPIVMNRNVETWSENVRYPLSDNYMVRVFTRDRSQNERTISIVRQSWRQSTPQPAAAPGAAAKRSPTTQPATGGSPGRPKAFDLDAAAKLLAEKVGGTWEKKTLRMRSEEVVVLDGRGPRRPGGIKGGLFRIYPFPFDRVGRKIIGRLGMGSSAPHFVAGSDERCTLLGLFGPTATSAAVIRSLKLRKVNVRGISISVAERLESTLDRFVLHLRYDGPADNRAPSLTISTRRIKDAKDSPDQLYAVIDPKRGPELIHHLLLAGCFEKVKNTNFRYPKGPAYTVTVPGGVRSGHKLEYYKDLGWGPGMLVRLGALRKVLDGDAAKAMDKLLANWGARGREWNRANKEQDRPVMKLVPTHVAYHSALILRAYDRQHGIVAYVSLPQKLHKTSEVPVSGKFKQGQAEVSYYRGKRIDKLLAPGGHPLPPTTQKALSGSVTVTPLPGDTDKQKVEVTFRDLVFKGFHIRKIGPLKAQLGLPGWP